MKRRNDAARFWYHSAPQSSDGVAACAARSTTSAAITPSASARRRTSATPRTSQTPSAPSSV